MSHFTSPFTYNEENEHNINNHNVLFKPTSERIVDSGSVVRHYHVTDGYIIIEEVFVGRSKSFLQSIKVLKLNHTMSGCTVVGALYGIREIEYHNTSSMNLVKQIFTETYKYDVLFLQNTLPILLKSLYTEVHTNNVASKVAVLEHVAAKCYPV